MKRAIIVTSTVAIILVLAVVAWFVFINDSPVENSTDTVETAQQAGQIRQSLTFGEELLSDAELESYREDAEETSGSLEYIVDNDSENIHWETEKIIPVTVFLPAGQSIDEYELDENDDLSLTVKKAPDGCSFVTAQVEYTLLVAAPLSYDSGQQHSVNINYIENEGSCDI